MSLLSLFDLSPANKIIDEIVRLTHPVATETNSLVKISSKISYPLTKPKNQVSIRFCVGSLRPPKHIQRAQLIKQTWGKFIMPTNYCSWAPSKVIQALYFQLLDFCIFSLINW
jgi:hypothetical protein